VAVAIRRATSSDLEPILSCHNAAWRRAYRDLFPAEYLDGDELLTRQRADWTDCFASTNSVSEIHVAELDGKVIGFNTFQPGEVASTVELTGIYVAPNYWSTGVGSALLRDARDRWRAEGYGEAYLWVAIDNPRAHRSYKKNGWVITEESKEQEFDGYRIPVEKLMLALNS
jgi:GNAT superfamily N-acetyltransferase